MGTDLDWFVVVEFNQASGQPADCWMAQGREQADETAARMTEISRRVHGRRETYRVFALEPVEEGPCGSCQGRRWVDDEGWQPAHEGERAVWRVPGAGLIPCGACNHGGWDVPVGNAPVEPAPSGGKLPVCLECGHRHRWGGQCADHSWGDSCPYDAGADCERKTPAQPSAGGAPVGAGLDGEDRG